jgi:hypothetical protein
MTEDKEGREVELRDTARGLEFSIPFLSPCKEDR